MRKKKSKLPEIAKTDRTTLDVGLFKIRSTHADPVKGEVLTREFESGLIAEYATTYALSDVDLRIFLAALSLAEIQHQYEDNKLDKGTQLDLFREFQALGQAKGLEAGYVTISTWELANASGIGWGGSQVKRITESLKRMSNVRATIRKGDRVMSGANMISFAHHENEENEAEAKIAIAISPHFAEAIFGVDNVPHIRVNLHEILQLEHPAAVIIHGMMSSRLSLRGKAARRHSTDIDKLTNRVYEKTDSASVIRNRRRKIQPALEEINMLPDWTVDYDSKTRQVTFERRPPKKAISYSKRKAAVKKVLDKPDEGKI
jgi:hypothetical protein